MQFFLLLAFFLLTPFSVTSQTTSVITEADVKNLALSSNLQIEMARLTQKIGEQDLPAAKAIYDTHLSSTVTHAQDKSQRTTTVFGTSTKTTVYDVELEQKTPWGGEFGLDFLNQRDSSNSPFVTFNPVYESEVLMSLKQPVVRNFFGFADRKAVQIARKKIQALDYRTQSNIADVLYQIISNYWNFYFTDHLAQFEKEAVLKARDLYWTNRKKAEIGLIEDSDLFAFAANYDIRETEFLVAQNQNAMALEQLRLDLGFDVLENITAGRENFQKISPVLFANALAVALEKRADFLALKKELEAQNLALAMAKNSQWPQLDVIASLGLNGIDPGYGSAVQNIGDGHPSWQVGMEFSVPLQNRQKRSDYQKSQFEKAKKILELKQAEQKIAQQIAEKVKQQGYFLKRMQASERARSNQYQKMLGETRKYEQGRSDSDSVIRYQNDYIDAKKLALRSQVDYKLALVDLQLVQGTLVDY